MATTAAPTDPAPVATGAPAVTDNAAAAAAPTAASTAAAPTSGAETVDPNVVAAAAVAAAAAANAAYQQPPMPYPGQQGGAMPMPQAMAPNPNQGGSTATASLYVGDLDASVTEAQLFDMFNALGPIASIRVCRDAVTRRSLGYAYVNYHAVADAERALDNLNYAPLKDRPMRIMWSQRDPAARKTGAGNIFIKNLDPLIDTRALHETFASFGPILSCKVAMDGETSKGYGFVHFEEAESAENAIKHVNGMLLNDRKVYVGPHVARKERMSKIEEMRSKFTNIYVKNLDESVTEDEFRKMFEAHGTVTSASLSKDADGKSRGFGFVNFASHEEARIAVEETHEKEINGKQLYVSRAQKKSEREEELRRQYERIREEKLNKYQGVNLYVKNLDDSIDDEKLREEFAVYGVITSAKVMRDDKTGTSKGFGFVCFSSPEEATKAVTDMNGRMIASKPIYVALAQRKEIRRQQLSAQMQQRNQIRMQQAVGMPGPYPGAPVFYPPTGMPPQAQRGPGMFYPQQMAPRPRWVGAAGGPPGAPQAGQPPAGPYPPQVAGQIPPQFNGVPPMRPRQQRQPGGRGQSMPPQQPGQPGAPAGVMPPNAPRGARPGQYKYTANTRNVPGQGVPNAGPVVPGGPKPALNSKSLADLPAEQQKRMLGEALFPLIQGMTHQAGKVTGMLLEMDQSELLHLIEDTDALKGKVEEAVAVLDEHSKQAEDQPEM
ncbi:Protein phosphatase PP2A regulatory subunit B [Geranomyces variabilis]|nr:Protein phosphatase PP2A regulatory subunit B [Geranomyces variabilis]